MSEESAKEGLEACLLGVGGADTQGDHDRNLGGVVAQNANRKKSRVRFTKAVTRKVSSLQMQ